MSILQKLLAYAADNYITLSKIRVDELVKEGYAEGNSEKIHYMVRLYYTESTQRWFSSLNM